MKRSFPFADNSTATIPAKQKKEIDSTIYDTMVNRMASNCYIDLLKEVETNPMLLVNDSNFQRRFVKAYETLSNEAKTVSQPLIENRNRQLLYRNLTDVKIVEMKRRVVNQFPGFLQELIPLLFTSTEILDLTSEGSQSVGVLKTIIQKYWQELDTEFSKKSVQAALRKHKNDLTKSHYNILKHYPLTMQNTNGIYPCMKDAGHEYKFKRNNTWFPISNAIGENGGEIILAKNGIIPKFFMLQVPSMKETFLCEKRGNGKAF